MLDPATGTGTFIVELLEHFRGNHDKLKYKYREELHANEVAILPYYVANLNIEATYQAITGEFAEFENICLADTLDMVEGLGIHSGHQHDMFGAFADENIERIKRQNRRKISVIIGNPPYNANQQNENDNNKNRAYPHIDDRIKRTYIKASTAQKTKLYDMYARFFRWASDRLGDEGIVAFITNRSFIDSRTFDGFRIMASKEFTEGYILDLGGDYKMKGTPAGGGNVFGIGTGVAISFWLKTRRSSSPSSIKYAVVESAQAEDKLSRLAQTVPSALTWTGLPNRKDGEWLNIPEDNARGLLPIVDRKGRKPAIFELVSLGVVTSRDDWVYDRDESQIERRLIWFIKKYESERKRISSIHKHLRRDSIQEYRIKLSRAVKNDLSDGVLYSYKSEHNRPALYRPFTKINLHYWSHLNEMQYQLNRLYPGRSPNNTILFTDAGSQKPFMACSGNEVFDYHFVGAAAATAGLARYRYAKSGERVDNITDWALNKFVAHYGKKAGITKDEIFHYVYAVLHDPVYRETYALNLKREFPRIPFYPDFAQWTAWGEALMAMHIGYEDVEPWAVERVDTPNAKRAEWTHPKPVLKSLPEQGLVRVDEDTQIRGIPREAWNYRLGNRSAIDWVLDQHKEKTPRDPTIREKFNTYRFADYKESMIDLLAKVVRVSIDTVAITEAMKALDRSGWDEGAGTK
ncbi:type ISP restriction/modification enzyme [Sphingopyxis granuli]|uniref:type ISP restriction/modification enzyme n=1 Tax=Sphingopyxis granuli TaxID=267128 RepID=UPI001FD08C09|nr:type ISP restriction/modification enzyme [Sphingopyxis granuli]